MSCKMRIEQLKQTICKGNEEMKKSKWFALPAAPVRGQSELHGSWARGIMRGMVGTGSDLFSHCFGKKHLLLRRKGLSGSQLETMVHPAREVLAAGAWGSGHVHPGRKKRDECWHLVCFLWKCCTHFQSRNSMTGTPRVCPLLYLVLLTWQYWPSQTISDFEEFTVGWKYQIPNLKCL